MKEITVRAYKGDIELHLVQVDTKREISWFFDDGDLDGSSEFCLVAVKSGDEITIEHVMDGWEVSENSVIVKHKKITNGYQLVDALHLCECLDIDIADNFLTNDTSIIEAYFGGWRISDSELSGEVIIEKALSVRDDFDIDEDDFCDEPGGDELWDSMDDAIEQMALKKFRLERELFPDHIKEKYGLPIAK